MTVNVSSGAGKLTSADVGADPSNAASGAVSAHLASADPHGDRSFALARVGGKLATTLAGTPSGAAQAGPASPHQTRKVQTAPPGGVSDLVVTFDNFSTQTSIPGGEIATGNSITVKAAIEYNGATFPLFFGGVRVATVEDGGQIKSSPCSVEIPGGATYYVRSECTGTNHPPFRLGPNDSYGTANTVDATGAMATTGSPGPYACSKVEGVPLGTRTPSAALIGDSILKGLNDAQQLGYMVRALGSSKVAVNIAAQGEAGYGFLTNHQRRGQHIALADYAYVAYGRNDVTQGQTAAQTEASLSSIWQMCRNRGCAVFGATITPITTSTDSWTSTANQTSSANDSVRQTVNTWLRAGAPVDPTALAPVAIGTGGALTCDVYNSSAAKVSSGTGGHPCTAIFELADAIETARNSGIFKIASVTGAVTSGSPNITGLTTGHGLLQGQHIAGTDIAAAATLSSVAANSAVMSANATGTNASEAISGALTSDGTHPSDNGHILLAVAVPTALFV